eukprot:1195113-Pyramimonas_sp.AAC.1
MKLYYNLVGYAPGARQVCARRTPGIRQVSAPCRARRRRRPCGSAAPPGCASPSAPPCRRTRSPATAPARPPESAATWHPPARRPP